MEGKKWKKRENGGKKRGKKRKTKRKMSEKEWEKNSRCPNFVNPTFYRITDQNLHFNCYFHA
jgi:hypothetical protein